MKEIPIILIKLYQKLIVPVYSSFLGDVCRFSPTCSEYAIISLKKEGLLKGIILAFKRFLKCQPFYQETFIKYGKS